MGREDRKDMRHHHQRKCTQSRGSTLLVSHAHQPDFGAHGQKQPSRSMAQPGTVYPRGHKLHPLPGAIQTLVARSENEIHGDLQCIGRLFRVTRWPQRLVHAPDAGLWCLLWICADQRTGQTASPRTSSGRSGNRCELCACHLHQRRTLALHDRRHDYVHLYPPLQIQNHGKDKVIYQRFRGRTDHW